MSEPRVVPQLPSDAPAVAGTERPHRAPSVALHAFGRGVLMGAIGTSALLAFEFDFGVPTLLVALLMGLLGFAFVSAGEGLVALLRTVLKGLFRRLGRRRAEAAVRAVPPAPVGRILGAFVYAAGDVLWPQTFLGQINLPIVGEMGMVLAGLTFMAVELARMEHRTGAARVALIAVPVVPTIACTLWVANLGFDGYLAAARVAEPPATSAAVDDAAARGPFAVRTLTYGSGTSLRRPEYAAPDLFTTPVDGAAVFGGCGGLAGSFYRWYWGFEFDALPVNGLVWYPEGAGPFPLVLIVHGNHAMSRPSEPGYAYLGEHLASQGYVVAAIDQNFLNGLLFFDGGFDEMPLRAWMVLQHLQWWRGWNEAPGNPFAGRIDLERVALVGHSRGGEAVAWAAHLNAHAMEPVSRVSSPGEFGFGIAAVVAIAPSDAYSGPDDRKPDLGAADYLLLAGGHDADTFLLYGVAQYERASSGADPDRFRALAYVHRANHGQFNTVWGDRDRGRYNSLLLNRAPLLSAGARQQTAEALVASFLRASLRGEPAYRAPFRNPSSARAGLPDGTVVTRSSGLGAVVLQDFEDGGAVGGSSGVRIEALSLRDGVREPGNRALRLDWSAGGRATYEVSVAPEDAERGSTASALSFALAAVPGTTPPYGVVVELEATDGRIARRTLGGSGPLPAPLVAPLPAHLVKARWLYGRNGFPRGIRPEEVVLQTFTVPLAAFEGAALVPAEVAVVRFGFGGGGAGAVYLDDVAWRGE